MVRKKPDFNCTDLILRIGWPKKTLDELRSALYFQIGNLTTSIIAFIARRKYILEALSVAGF